MTVNELINQLKNADPNAEIGYEIHCRSIELLCGENEDTGWSIEIPKPEWQ